MDNSNSDSTLFDYINGNKNEDTFLCSFDCLHNENISRGDRNQHLLLKD